MDLTLNEYRGLFEKELARILKDEARKICGVDSLETNSRGTVNDFCSFLHLKYKNFKSHLRNRNRNVKFYLCR